MSATTGIPDEYGILKEGEVFCQWQDTEEHNSVPQIVVGDCIVCRAPAMHAGDIRRVKAVDNSAFHHLKNVIVFNTQGARDLPNQLGGGDLDGDDYTLIWDPKLLIEENALPMDYTPPDPTRVDRVSLPFIKANFVNHLKNDMLGQIANNHLAWTDLKSPFSYECSELARLHSVAVDFAKTGVPADLPMGLRAFKWPDFMGKPDHSYESKKVLGKLFHIVDPEPIFEELSQQEVEGGVDYLLTKPTIPLPILKIVAKAKVAYDTEVWQLLLRYRLSEAEAFSGVVLKNLKRRKIKDHDLKDPVKEAFKIIVEEAKQSILREYEREVGPRRRAYNSAPLGGKITSNQMLAVAVYQVTYYSAHQHLTEDWEDEDNQSFTNVEEALVDIQDVNKKSVHCFSVGVCLISCYDRSPDVFSVSLGYSGKRLSRCLSLRSETFNLGNLVITSST
jgi:RNA-dependent RNA polymerase